MKVFDSFMFCHELDMLELRLKVLYDHVDKFILVEFPYTHQNKSKPLYFAENRQRFKWAEDKIIYYSSEVEFAASDDELAVENTQRQILYELAKTTEHGTGDVLLMSDVDEIPSREAIQYLRDNPLEKPVILEQDFYYYNITCPMKRRTFGTVASCFTHKLGNIGDMRKYRESMDRRWGGWHFSYFMNHQEIARKLQSFAHKNYAKPPYTDKNYIDRHIKAKTNFLEKKKGNVEFDPLPEYMMAQLRKYPVFVGETA